MERKLSMEKTSGSGILTGFKNKTREENGRWWTTRKWLVQSAVWLALISGVSLIALLQLRQAETFSLTQLVGVFTGLMGWMVAFGIIILTQGEVVEEKQSGTAEWVLSAPLSRVSFILSKLSVNAVWLLAILVVLQGIVFNLSIGLFNVGPVPWLNLAWGLTLQGLHLIFWLSLVLVLGTFFKTRNPVIGVPLIFLFLQEIVPTIVGTSNSWVSLVMPQRLPEYSAYLLNGNPLPSIVPIVTAGIASLVFVLLAILRFNREEFKGT